MSDVARGVFGPIGGAWPFETSRFCGGASRKWDDGLGEETSKTLEQGSTCLRVGLFLEIRGFARGSEHSRYFRGSRGLHDEASDIHHGWVAFDLDMLQYILSMRGNLRN